MSNDLTQISLPTATGRRYWRSLDELAQTSEFREFVDREFPTGATEVLDGASRRNVLKLMAASFGLAGLTACRRPVEHVLPQSKGVENYIPGKPSFYSSVFQLNGEAMGILVETHDGRPTKIEGNPDHPYSQGAANVLAHASLLSLYDPDRSPSVLNGGEKSSWEEFDKAVQTEIAGKLGDGTGLRFLTPRLISPSYKAVKVEALKKYPKATWTEFDPFAPEQSIEATKIAFGQPLTPHYAYDKAKVIVAISSDFLGVDSTTVLPTRLFSKGRQVEGEEVNLNRLYSIESAYTLTGANADHRLRLKPSEMTAFVSDLAEALSGAAPAAGSASDKRAKYVSAIAKDLLANKGASLVIGGPGLPAATQALIFGINQMLDNLGTTVTLTKPVFDTENSGVAALKSLVDELSAGKVSTLVILGGNPAFTAPYDLHLADAIKKAAHSIYLGPDVNETAAVAKWHIPEAHYLESWGDAQSADGTAAVQQPLIEPLYQGKTGAEVAAYLTGYKDQSGYDIVANYWKTQPSVGSTVAWNKALNDGVIASKLPEVKVTADVAKAKAAVAALPKRQSDLEVSFHPSFTVFDGSYANNAWAQELPDPMTKLVWGNAAMVSPATAKRLNLTDGELVNLKRSSFIVPTAVMIQPGHADNAISVILGYGRERVGRVGQGVGSNGYPLRTTAAYYLATDLTIEKVGGKAEALATTQNHHDMHGRPIVREATLAEYKKDPAFPEKAVEVPKLIQLYPDKTWDTGNQWGMTIDLTACTGCNACAIACQAENNIPVVGKDQVLRGREMHWIRIDRYYTGAPADDPDHYPDDPQVVTQPVPCMQCENAPCENVCPVAATVHSPEGLNDMTYNRCVGTRYCMNNCPFKVRRFNFLNWHRDIEEIQKGVFNPDVTVRMRGIMEKCTYCVQRIQETKIRYKTSGIRPDAGGRIAYKDGDIQTACQQTCPADAIVFGDIRDPESRVSKLKKQERNYAMLAELNVRPRTTYLGKVRNPNTELEQA